MTGDNGTVYDTIINYESDKELDIDVPSVGDYQVIDQIVDAKFDIQKQTIKQVLRNRTFNVPAYQRLYSWEEEQHHELWGEIQGFTESRVEKQVKDISDTFFGSMYFAVQDSNSSYEIIDGQQRITTLAIVFRVILEHVESTVDELESGDDLEKVGKLVIDQLEDILYEVDPLRGKDPSFTLNKHDKEFFNHLILGEESRLEYLLSDERARVDGRKGVAKRVSTLVSQLNISDELIEDREFDDRLLQSYIPVYDSNEKLLDAYRYYYSRISELLEEQDSPRNRMIFLMNLSNYIQRSFYIGRFEIRDAGSDFRMQIFEILNDRGIDLTKIDRIRANVVNRFVDETEGNEYIKKWEDIVANFGTSASKIESFLGTYLAAVDENVDSQTEARNNLKHAFSGRTPPNVKVEPRLKSVGAARQFIDDINDHLEYYDHITNPHLDEYQLNLDDTVRDQCEDILIRLNNLSTSQWLPFVLYTYKYTDDTIGNDEAFLQLLQAVENINIRRLVADANPNLVESLFVNSCDVFREYTEEGRENPYKDITSYLLDYLDSNTSQLFGRSLADSLIQYVDMSNNYAKQLLWKVSAEAFANRNGSIERRLDIDDLHLEHVLPQTLVANDGDATWVESFFDTDGGDARISELASEYVALAEAADEDLEDEEIERRDELNSFLKSRFVRDIGNCILLKGRDNVSASNNPLSQKLISYYNTDDFAEIEVNRFFTEKNSAFPTASLATLRGQYDHDGNRLADVDVDAVNQLNRFWTYSQFEDRRVEIVRAVLDSLAFPSRPNEFEFESEYIRGETHEEISRRLDARSL